MPNLFFFFFIRCAEEFVFLYTSEAPSLPLLLPSAPVPPPVPFNHPLALPQGEADRPDPGGFLPRDWPRGAGAGADAAPEDAGEAAAEGGDDVRPPPGGVVAVPPRAAVSAAGEGGKYMRMKRDRQNRKISQTKNKTIRKA